VLVSGYLLKGCFRRAANLHMSRAPAARPVYPAFINAAATCHLSQRSDSPPEPSRSPADRRNGMRSVLSRSRRVTPFLLCQEER
jgi:hypothetical protein